MRIALLDLNHRTRGVHTNTAPYAVGLIARHLRRTVAHPFDVRMFKDAEKALSACESWAPDVIGLSQYVWNSELNLHVAGLLKEKSPGSLVVAGGPNLDFSPARRKAFFEAHPYVDLCVPFDGEIPFAEAVRLLLAGKTPRDLRKAPVAGAYAWDPDEGKLADNVVPAPRPASLDEFGAMYAEGVFDEFLDQGYHPHLQTHRGCPFECAYCHTGDRYYTKMLFLSPDIFRREMDCLGRRFAGQHNVVLYLGNTNMSLFEQDFKIAEIIRETQERFDWPRIINVNCGKDPQKLLRMLSLIKFEATISVQTLTPKVLQLIKRKNIPFEDFIAFMEEATRRTGEVSTTDLILCLPEETRESFLETMRKVLNSGLQNIVVYTLMALKGTRLASEEFAARYRYDIRHRVVPRQFSVIRGRKVLDTEEVVVGTSTMPFADYHELRGVTFTATTFFASTELIPLKRLLRENGADIADWVFGIHRRIPEYADLARQYEGFMRETREELFPTREALLAFFEKEEHFAALCEGKLGDNLLRKYKHLVLSRCFPSFLALSVSEARVQLSRRLPEEKAARLIAAVEAFLSSRDLQPAFEKGDFDAVRRATLEYDVPAWAASADPKVRLEDAPGPCGYVVRFPEGVGRRYQDLLTMNRDVELALQILYRDGTIRDFWPRWEPERPPGAF